MPITELTVENQTVADIVAEWVATPPADLPEGWGIYDFRRTEDLVNPCVIIGHSGVQRETAKGMHGTGRVRLIALVRSSIGDDEDLTTVEAHRQAALAIDEALRNLAGTQFQLTTVHAMLRDGVQESFQDRRQMTEVAYTVVATRMEEAP